MADCTNAAIRNIFRLEKCEYRPDNKSLYSKHLVDNSWGKTYKGWPTSIELHMGYKRDELRRDRLDRGRQVMSSSIRPGTRAPTRGGMSIASPLSALGQPAREDLRTSSPNGRSFGSPTMSPNARDFQTRSPVRISVP